MTARTDSWKLKLLMVSVASLFALVVALGAGEYAVRYRERHRPTVPGVMPFLYYRNASLGYALVRDYDYFGWVHVNPQGFRGERPTALQKPAGVFRILAIGGSTTFDTFVSHDTLAWPARLESWLRQLDPSHQVEVINAGTPGYNIWQDQVRLQTELYRYQPDLIVFYQGHNDLFGNLRSSNAPKAVDAHRPNPVATVTPWGGWLEQNSLLYAKVAERIKLALFARLKKSPAPAAPAGEAEIQRDAFTRSVRQYLAAAATLEIPVIVPELVQVSGTATEESDPARKAVWQHTVPFASPATVLQGYQEYNAVLKEEAARYNDTFIPMADLAIAGEKYYAVEDPIHFSDLGADRFAEGLARRWLALRPATSHVP